jgi:MFS family permease
MSSQTLAVRFRDNRYITALAYRDFRHMWLANLSAQAAAWALIVGRGWLVFDRTGSSAWVGITTFAAMGPIVLVPPIAGVLADRFDRRNILACTYAVNLASNLVLTLLVFTGWLTVWHIVSLSLVNGIARAFQMPTSQAFAANLVPRHALLNALSLTQATQHASRLAGALVATPLLALHWAPAAFLLCAAFYGIGWLQILRIETRVSGSVRAGEGFVRNFTNGLRYAWSEPLIRMVLVLVFFHCGLTMAFESTFPGFVHEKMSAHYHDEGFGTLIMGVGLGGLVGSIYIGGVTSALTRGRLLLVTGLLSGVGQVMLGFTSAMPAAFVSAMVMGGADAAFMTMGQAITQSLAKDEFRGRLASINTFSLGGVMAIMNLSNGFVSSHYGSAAVLLATGALFMVVMLLSPLAMTPRRVYTTGIPAEAHAA